MLPSTWHFEITGYGWASSVAGSTGFGTLPTLAYHASFLTLLEHLQGGFMSSIVARNDTFIGGIDFVWSQIGGSSTLSNADNVLYGGKTSLTLNEAFVTAFGGVRVPLGGLPKSRTLWHRRRPQFLQRDQDRRQQPARIVQRDRNREQGLGHAGRRFRRAL